MSARGRTWIATRRARIGWPLPPPPLLLDSRGVGAPQQPASAPAALAAGRGALWALVVDGDAARLELRDPETGRLRRSTRVPPSRALVATRGAAWLLEPSGRLRRVGAKGAVRVRLRRILAIASDSGARLWALRSDGRTVLQLDHESGRVLSLGRTAGKVSQLALTRTGVWLAGPGTGRLEHIRRRER